MFSFARLEGSDVGLGVSDVLAAGPSVRVDHSTSVLNLPDVDVTADPILSNRHSASCSAAPSRLGHRIEKCDLVERSSTTSLYGPTSLL